MIRTLLLAICFAATAFAATDYEARYKALATDQSLDSAQRLHQLFDLDWEHTLSLYPEFASSLGYNESAGKWTDMSQEAIAARKAMQKWPIPVLNAIDRAKLSPDDQLNYDLFRRDVEVGLEGNQFPGELMPISQLGGVQRDVAATIEQMQKASVKDYENVLSRLRSAPVLISQNLDLLKRGVAAGVTIPQVVLRDLPAQFDSLLTDDPMKSALLQAFTDFPVAIPAKEQDRLRAEAVKIYREQLVPAYQNLKDYLVKEYIPHARKTIAAEDLPNGEKWYAYDILASTTTRMSPEEIHQIGLSEVKRIRGEMGKVIADAKFQGSFDDFLAFLAKDPQFYYTSADDLLTGYRDIAKRIDAELPKLFHKLPRMTYGVKPVPDYNAKSQPGAYYEGGSERAGRPGWFVANTYNLPSRPKWAMECLTLHEGVPGHHLQISLAQEMENVPEFRKYSGNSAYMEGWALYCEGLGYEIGLYKDPYSRFGQLSYEMWRAVRLVVDTGMHAKGWSREQAIGYMCANAAKDKHDATVEIDRYIVWPGQALSYKLGQLKIVELRDYAQGQLGEAFDLRAFHDKLLANGSLPLDVLDRTMRDWVAAQKSKTTK